MRAQWDDLDLRTYFLVFARKWAGTFCIPETLRTAEARIQDKPN